MSAVQYQIRDRIAVITIHNPPVNALSLAVRQGLYDATNRARADGDVDGIVLMGAGQIFVGGADISEFGKPYVAPTLWDIDDLLRAMPKPTVAAIDGFALGGGLELAFHCHWRLATATAQLGLPEVLLGLMPGAGGTQFWTRLAGPESALAYLTSGKSIKAVDAAKIGIIDGVADIDLLDAAIAFVQGKVGGPLPDISSRTDRIDGVDPAIFDNFRAAQAGRWKGLFSPERIVRCIEAASSMPLEEALALERAEFAACAASPQSKALIHLFFAERKAGRVDVAPAKGVIDRIGVIGAGTMGAGIAMAVANAGLSVLLVDIAAEQIERARQKIGDSYANAVRKGRMPKARADAALGRIAFASAFEPLADCDLVIEAVFEDLAIKQQLIERLNVILRDDAIIATNTSMLDVDALAAACRRPERFLGMHFFSPADVMKLLEIVAGRATDPAVLAQVVKLGRKLGKLPIVCGNGEGFIGNFMLDRYGREADLLIEDGASPWQIDAVMHAFGFPMGLFEMRDMAGLDVIWRIRQQRHEAERLGRYPLVADKICAAGRFGQKTGAGYYHYEGRMGAPDPFTDDVIANVAAEKGIARRSVSDAEVEERLLFAMVNAGAQLLDNGIAQRASDIDLVMVNGFGFPRHKGGPMFWGEQQGLARIAQRLADWAVAEGVDRWPLSARLSACASGTETWDTDSLAA